MISRWKAELLENMAAAFEKGSKPEEPDVDSQEFNPRSDSSKWRTNF
jgi:hypothetical protein